MRAHGRLRASTDPRTGYRPRASGCGRGWPARTHRVSSWKLHLLTFAGPDLHPARSLDRVVADPREVRLRWRGPLSWRRRWLRPSEHEPHDGEARQEQQE